MTEVRLGNRTGVQSGTRFRYVIMAVLLSVTIVNFADRGALSFASEQVIKEFNFNRSSWGAVLGFFGYGYMVGGLLGGVLSDRWGPKRVWILAGLAWSLCEAATALAGELGLAFIGGSALAGFATVRILFGISEGPAFPLLNKSVSLWATPRERAVMSSLVLVSAPVGALIAAPISVGLMLLTGSWRAMFVLLGLASLATIGILYLLFTDSPAENSFVNAAELEEITERSSHQDSLSPNASGLSSRESIFSPSLLLNAIGFFSSLYVTFLVLTWMPKYLQDQQHVSLSALSYTGMVPWLGACGTVLMGGLFSDWLLARTHNLNFARSWFAGGSLLVVGVLLLCVQWTSDVWSAILLIAVANAMNQLPNSAFWIIIVDISPQTLVGLRSGITLVIASSASVFAPTLTGILVQSYGYDAMFQVAAGVCFVGAAAMLAIRLKTARAKLG
jgi:ACS family hexuronate transporter-like MFS transporter